ncbi:MAG TPA: transglycosylase SLT domain-containing protein [Gaiellaceae bacterium]|nr:transglycosylase SLT domain-containing protein [Gaiellaceae bacterium]
MVGGVPPLATQLSRADAALHAALVGWNERTPLPRAAEDAAAREQVIELRLAGDARLERVVLSRLPPRLRADVADDVAAHRDLSGLAPKQRKGPPIRLGAALPLAMLRRYYLEAQRRSGIPWRILAAVNDVETSFGRLREASSSGALGPMQFMPSTWASYGRGDVRDPHAAILAAARYLRAAGGPKDLRTALWHYNPSTAYVDAVLRLEHRIARSRLGLAALYARRLFVRGPNGWKRLN